jgi:hypothetical protein
MRLNPFRYAAHPSFQADPQANEAAFRERVTHGTPDPRRKNLAPLAI